MKARVTWIRLSKVSWHISAIWKADRNGYVHLSSHDMKALCEIVPFKRPVVITANVLFPPFCTISVVIFKGPLVPFSFPVDLQPVVRNICDACSYTESISGSFLTTAAKKTFWRRKILINERLVTQVSIQTGAAITMEIWALWQPVFTVPKWTSFILSLNF